MAEVLPPSDFCRFDARPCDFAPVAPCGSSLSRSVTLDRDRESASHSALRWYTMPATRLRTMLVHPMPCVSLGDFFARDVTLVTILLMLSSGMSRSTGAMLGSMRQHRSWTSSSFVTTANAEHDPRSVRRSLRPIEISRGIGTSLFLARRFGGSPPSKTCRVCLATCNALFRSIGTLSSTTHAISDTTSCTVSCDRASHAPTRSTKWADCAAGTRPSARRTVAMATGEPTTTLHGFEDDPAARDVISAKSIDSNSTSSLRSLLYSENKTSNERHSAVSSWSPSTPINDQ